MGLFCFGFSQLGSNEVTLSLTVKDYRAANLNIMEIWFKIEFDSPPSLIFETAELSYVISLRNMCMERNCGGKVADLNKGFWGPLV